MDDLEDSNHRVIRLYDARDFDAVVGVWYRSGMAAYTYLPTFQSMTFETAAWVFKNVILPKCQVWVGTLEGKIVAYMALNGSYIDRLYIDPAQWRKVWGTQLIGLAKQLSPAGLECHTHQENIAGRSFYERNGFIAVKFGISPPPESAPDVEYHWRPLKNQVN